ncbi:alpha/beta hydrolase [Oxalobacter sp. OttesenSCG-928-P03]|nr:alpha/beta hydrolase [Oxalobacter sp. OttesenSCG-928-P03]
MRDPLPLKSPGFSVNMREVVWLEAEGHTLRAVIYYPGGKGPFPAAVCIHGGTWVSGDRTATHGFSDLLASYGMVIMAIDFRMPPSSPYPAALQDINYAVRWLRQHAAQYRIMQDKVGLIGVSSGGHLALLSALCPDDSRYTAIPMEGGFSARTDFLITCSGVLDPTARYRMAEKQGMIETLLGHRAFFGDAETMEEANPARILEEGGLSLLPQALFFQGGDDSRVPQGTAARIADLYNVAGGHAKGTIYPGMEHNISTWCKDEVNDMLGQIMDMIRTLSAKPQNGKG